MIQTDPSTTAAESAWSEIEKPKRKRQTSKRSTEQREQADDDCHGPVEPNAFYLCAESKQWMPFRTKLPAWKSLGVIRYNDTDSNWMWTTGRQIGWVPTIEDAKARIEGKVI